MAKLVTAALFLVALLLGAFVYLQLDRPVTRVVVAGQLLQAERLEIEAAVLEHLDGGILSADLETLSAGILALGWPRAVAIRRSWPQTLSLEVEKPAVVARWQDAYLASDGSVVHLPVGATDLPRFDCAIAEPRDAMEMFHRLSEAAARSGLHIEHLSENVFGEWQVQIADGESEVLPVMLGAEAVEERLERFLLVYGGHLKARVADIDGIDARYHNGIAVRWRDDAAALLAGVGKEQRIESTYGL